MGAARSDAAPRLTHLDEEGRLKMVDVGGKERTERVARVRGEIRMVPRTARLIADNKVPKGSVLEAARLAGIMAAKRTGELIPLCHPLNLTAVSVDFQVGEDRVEVEAEAKIVDRTGVEMEALVAASTALLTIYDMCKGVDRGMVIGQLRLMEKRGGRSGTWVRDEGEN
ncbi:MAG: cyclic pyranopterin monophosphate synthase MoaC [Deltaproteobacteria bacterium]|nr:cyclic pyranopterin monophosphate synthase MoaC [Deltaproteobacteria bacterium]